MSFLLFLLFLLFVLSRATLDLERVGGCWSEYSPVLGL